ncbi:MAG TPA: redoxin domain-containing protein [Candidatus Acidoferrum sp.]|nr:redoxin domain-containing protein [Candidatus Acidoferrum sp.]
MNKRSFLLPVLITVALLGPLARAEEEPTLKQRAEQAAAQLIGKPAPALQLTTLEGKPLDLAQYYGKRAVYLKIWATWCVPCRAQMPHFERTFESAGNDLAVIAIDAGFNETRADIIDTREEFGLRMPIVVDDGTLATMFGLQMTPLHIVIDRSGIIRHLGQAADDKLEAALQAAKTAPLAGDFRAGAAPQPVQTAAVGDALPALNVDTLDKRHVALRDAKAAHGTALVFMNSWCESYLAKSRPDSAKACAQVREQVEQLKAAHPDVRWIAVSSGLWTAVGDLRKYAQDSRVTLPLTLDTDGQLFRRFGIHRVPSVVLADGNGKIVSRGEGYDAQLDLKLARLSGGEPK